MFSPSQSLTALASSFVSVSVVKHTNTPAPGLRFTAQATQAMRVKNLPSCSSAGEQLVSDSSSKAKRPTPNTPGLLQVLVLTACPTVLDTDVLHPDSPISSLGKETCSIGVLLGHHRLGSEADSEDDAAALHARADEEAGNPNAELCCDVQRATPATDQIRALEDSVQPELDAQQRENESLDEARRAFPKFPTQEFVEKPLTGLRDVQDMKVRGMELVRWRSLDEVNLCPRVENVMARMRSVAFSTGAAYDKSRRHVVDMRRPRFDQGVHQIHEFQIIESDTFEKKA